MNNALFLKLTSISDKETQLKKSITRANIDSRRNTDDGIFPVDYRVFKGIDGAPFAYWVNKNILEKFTSLESISTKGILAQRALSTNNDFRFIRLSWELLADRALSRPADGWLPLSKGGSYSKFYFDIHLLVNWRNEGAEMEEDALRKFPYLNGDANWVLHRECNYLDPGLTWPLRTSSNLSVRILPKGCLFSNKGPTIFDIENDTNKLLTYLSILNSNPFMTLVGVQLAAADAAAKSYEIGVLQRTPFPDWNKGQNDVLATLAKESWVLGYQADKGNTTSHAFTFPALVRNIPGTLSERIQTCIENRMQFEIRCADIQQQIDSLCFDLYDFPIEDRLTQQFYDRKKEEIRNNIEKNEVKISKELIYELVDWLIGVIFGRFDVNLVIGEHDPTAESEPFDPLPSCSPGMLTNDDGMPVDTIPKDYPIDIDLNGILKESDDIDSASVSERSLSTNVKKILHLAMPEIGPGLETELAELLGVPSLEEYIRKPSGFFAHHLSMYSKSRRKAPIYWPLSTASGWFTLWIYYPRLTVDTLFKAINDFIDPKLAEIVEDMAYLKRSRSEDRRTRARIEILEGHELELKAFREELLRVTKLPYKPNRDDGVLISAAPLYKLFGLKKWRTDLEKCWKSLEKGEFDWAYLAHAIWPERVESVCRKDKSIAIAHGLEHLYEGQN